MKHKRLNRDLWGFQYYPYYQMRIDDPLFHGLACLIRFSDGKSSYWETPKAGRIQVIGAGMTWLELIPDDQDRVITAVYFPKGTHDPERKNYPRPANQTYQPSFWYVDIIEGTETDDCDIAVFIDKYLDVIFTPEGDIRIDDRDELDTALASGELTHKQYDRALAECDSILHNLCEDIPKTDHWCAEVMKIVEQRILDGEPNHLSREILEWQKQWSIRPILEAEIPACAVLIQKAFRTVADDFGFTRVNAPRFTAFAVTDERVRQEMEDPHRSIIGCFDQDQQLVGCYSLRLSDDNSSELNHLCVLPEYRHLHIGKMLLQDAFERAFQRGAHSMMISIVEENTMLKRWYESFGFSPVETKKFDFLPFTCGYMQRML
ncbi:MAG: GNAT family N-acetyltransferase [Clostridia bacterium]|nr:GNAT family N-acetyltransferase [Clostridia bacterium]